MDRQALLHRNIGIRHAVAVLCLLVIPLSVTCRDYRTQTLRAAAMKLGVEHEIDLASSGSTSTIVLSSGQSIVVRISEEGVVEHIGLPLFSDIMRQQQPLPVYDCIEYAALDRSLIHTENDLLLQKIQLFKGSWKTISTIGPADECSIMLRDEKAYQVVWQRDGHELVNMAIPVDYELLSLSSRRELERTFVRDILRHPDKVQSDVLLASAPQLANATMCLKMVLSDYSQQTIDISVRQWVAYCERQGCTPYYISDDTEGTVATSYLHMRNQAMGYHHLLELSCPVAELDNAEPKLQGKAHLFIPNIDGNRMYGSEENLKANRKRFR